MAGTETKRSENDRHCRRFSVTLPLAALGGALFLAVAVLALILAWSGPEGTGDGAENGKDETRSAAADGGAAEPDAAGAGGEPDAAVDEAGAGWPWLAALTAGDRQTRLLLLPAIAILMLWLAARCYLYARYRRMALAQWSNEGRVPEPLGGQRRLIDQLVELLRRRSPDADGSLIVVRGEWGSGKSYLIRRLRHELDGQEASWPDGKPPVVVYIDIWRHSSEPDLHFALLEALLSHPAVPPGPAFFRYPMALLPVLLLRSVTRIFKDGQMHLGPFKLAVTLPTLIWQHILEQVVWRIRRRRRSVLWILDEIDRSSPAMAQAAVTLARRALNLPGCVVLLPYVQEQLRFKVFNPYAVSRPDIGSTLQAVMWEYALRVDPNLSLQKALLEGERLPDPLGVYRAVESGDGKKASRESTDLLEQILAAEPAATLERHLQWRLSTWLAGARRGVRERLSFLFEEKYLSLRLDVPPLTASEVAEMVQRFPHLEPLYRRFMTENGLDGSGEEAAETDRKIRAAIAGAIEAYHKRSRIDSRHRPMIRHLEGDLFTQLSGLGPVGAVPGSQEPAAAATYAQVVLVTAVLLAYRRSLEQILTRA